MNAAYRVAKDWALWFQCPFFVVEIGPDVYAVAARVCPNDKVVARIGL
jgi:hypothetical protein